VAEIYLKTHYFQMRRRGSTSSQRQAEKRKQYSTSERCEANAKQRENRKLAKLKKAGNILLTMVNMCIFLYLA
jgi:hypothetical protein